MTEFRFQSPLWLLALVPVLAALVWSLRRKQSGTVLYSSIALFQSLPVTMAQRFKKLLPWIRTAGLVLVVFALARPQYGEEEFRVRTEGVAIEMCLDRSGSMRALDFQLNGRQVTRLEAVKDVFRRFVAGEDNAGGRPDDLVGLIAFGGFADNLCPLTLDHDALIETLNTVKCPEPIFGRNGQVLNVELYQEESATAIGDAVAAGVDRLRNTKAKSKVLILLSDGENTTGVLSPDESIKLAKEYGVKIYAIGVGTTGQVPVEDIDRFGRKHVTLANLRMDEATLRKLADETGGKYFPATSTAALENVYAEIDKLEKTETEGQVYTHYRELFATMLVPGLCLILLEIVLASTRFRTLP